MNEQKKKVPECNNAITLKSIKTGFGHDGRGLDCTVYLNNKMLGSYRNTDHGPDGELTFRSPENKEALIQFCKENSIAEFMFNNGWEFYKDVEKITLHPMIEYLVANAFNKNQTEKNLKWIEKNRIKMIIYGTTLNFNATKWSNIKTLFDLLEYEDGLSELQKDYDEVKKGLAEGEVIFNTKEQLTELGIKM